MSSGDDEQWTACARALGLELRETGAFFHLCDNFGFMIRALGPRVEHGQSGTVDHWIHGTWAGRPVLVTTYRASLKNMMAPRTAVLAAIDPPLLVGLQMRASYKHKLMSESPGIKHALPHPELEALYNATAFPSARIHDLFASQSGRWQTALQLVQLAGVSREVRVSDNIVRATIAGPPEPSVVHSVLDMVTAAASLLGAKRERVPRVPGELPDAAWGALATREGLAFDASRMKVSGVFRETLPVELRFHTADGEAYAAIRVSLPRALGVGLRVHGRSGGQDMFYEDDWNDFELGDRAFDDAFLVHGTNEMGVRALFGRADIRSRALGILGRTLDLNLVDTHLATGFNVGLDDAAFLEWLLVEMTALARALGAGSEVGPYR
jgi:hypothetical protein